MTIYPAGASALPPCRSSSLRRSVVQIWYPDIFHLHIDSLYSTTNAYLMQDKIQKIFIYFFQFLWDLATNDAAAYAAAAHIARPSPSARKAKGPKSDPHTVSGCRNDFGHLQAGTGNQRKISSGIRFTSGEISGVNSILGRISFSRSTPGAISVSSRPSLVRRKTQRSVT